MWAKHISKRKVLLLLGDVIIILFSSSLAFYLVTGKMVNALSVYTGATIFSLIACVVVFYVADLYNIHENFKSAAGLTRQISAVVFAGVLSIFVFYLFRQWQLERGIFLAHFGLIGLLVILWRLCYTFLFRVSYKPKRTLVVGSGEGSRPVWELLQKYHLEYEVVGLVDDIPPKQECASDRARFIGAIGDIPEILQTHKIDHVVITPDGGSKRDVVRIALQCRESGVSVIDTVGIYEMLDRRIPAEHINGLRAVFAPRLNSTSFHQRLKRLGDIVVAGIGFVVSIPFLLIGAILVKIGTRNSVLFRQVRIGRSGKPFEVLKLRTMKEHTKGPLWTEDKDSRIPNVCKVVRKMRIDELPQFYNVLKGDMSFIGPRPEQLEVMNKHLHEFPSCYHLRHIVRPGITGWAQVNYPYGATVKDTSNKLAYDLYYIKNFSLFLDMQIFMKTIRVLLLTKGAR